MLNKKEPDWLSPEEYQMIVAPSLKVCAELAASRGDPTLFQDLPSMICLVHLVTRLKDYYIEEWVVLSATSSEASLQRVPEAACMMVLTEGNVAKDELSSMIDSLNKAYEMVKAAGIGVDADGDIQKAWGFMKKSKNEQFLALLEQVAKKFVIEIDGWEKAKNG